jgi:hypothetical protein
MGAIGMNLPMLQIFINQEHIGEHQRNLRMASRGFRC